MGEVEVTNLQRIPVDSSWLARAADAALALQPGGEHMQISLVLVGSERMRHLNQRFRGIRSVTDVLAFPLSDDFVSTRDFLGEVVVCVEKGKRQASTRGHTLRQELTLLVIHGVLHLLGYEDKERTTGEAMKAREREVLESLGLTGSIV